MTPDQRKKFRARATRVMRELRKEEATGYIHDGSGKQYRAGVLFLLIGDLEKAATPAARDDLLAALDAEAGEEEGE